MKRTVQIIFLCLFIVNIANSHAGPQHGYDYTDVFDRVIRSKFDIQTNRRLDLHGVNPYNVYKVVQEGNFIFFIGDENGVFMKLKIKTVFIKLPMIQDLRNVFDSLHVCTRKMLKYLILFLFLYNFKIVAEQHIVILED